MVTEPVPDVGQAVLDRITALSRTCLIGDQPITELHPDRHTDKAIRNDIAGWTPQRRERKVAQLASVIVPMNAGNAPDLLGGCEVENRFILDWLVDAVKDLLPTRTYAQITLLGRSAAE